MSFFLVFILGLFFGSFLNVLADRLPRDESINGRSHCESCKHVLSPLDLIPVLSFVYLRGKCKYCHAQLSIQYPLVEILTGFLFALVYYFLLINHQVSIINLFFDLAIISAFIVVFFADLRHGIIPDKVILPAIIVNLAWLIIVNPQMLVNHLLCGLGALLFFLVIYIYTKSRGMGFGDVKLAFLIGLFLGFPGAFFALYLSFLTGAIVGIILIVWRKKTLKSTVPFATFLMGSAIFSFFFQEIIAKAILPYF